MNPDKDLCIFCQMMEWTDEEIDRAVDPSCVILDVPHAAETLREERGYGYGYRCNEYE